MISVILLTLFFLELCNIATNKQDMENVGDFKYLGSKLSKDGSVTGEVEKKVKQSRKISEVLKATSNRNARTEMKERKRKKVQESVLLCAVLYSSEIRTLFEGQKLRLRVVELEYLRRASNRLEEVLV